MNTQKKHYVKYTREILQNTLFFIIPPKKTGVCGVRTIVWWVWKFCFGKFVLSYFHHLVIQRVAQISIFLFNSVINTVSSLYFLLHWDYLTPSMILLYGPPKQIKPNAFFWTFEITLKFTGTHVVPKQDRCGVQKCKINPKKKLKNV